MKQSIFLWAILLAIYSQMVEADARASVSIGLETRYFYQDASHKLDRSQYSADALIEAAWQNSERRHNFVSQVHFRYDRLDDERRRVDIRKAYWQYAMSNWEIKLGIDTIFHGVTETTHLVNVINQSDFAESSDQEQLLGQPMLNFNLLQTWGDIEVYLLPYFRERTFPSPSGRPRASPRISSNEAIYTDNRKDDNLDVFVRFSRSLHVFDFALSHFRGTSREPRFDALSGLVNEGDQTVLVPIYDRIDQTGLELQATTGNIQWKAEVVERQWQSMRSLAYVIGKEKTWYAPGDLQMDVGLIVEYARDDRSTSVMNNDASLGLRLTGQNVDPLNLVLALTQDLDNGSRAFYLEARKPLNDRLILEFEARGVDRVAQEDPLAPLIRENYLELQLHYHF